MKNFLNISDFSSADLREIIDQAMKKKKIEMVLINLLPIKMNLLKGRP